jgi:hypothetical protein
VVVVVGLETVQHITTRARRFKVLAVVRSRMGGVAWCSCPPKSAKSADGRLPEVAYVADGGRGWRDLLDSSGHTLLKGAHTGIHPPPGTPKLQWRANPDAGCRAFCSSYHRGKAAAAGGLQRMGLSRCSAAPARLKGPPPATARCNALAIHRALTLDG